MKTVLNFPGFVLLAIVGIVQAIIGDYNTFILAIAAVLGVVLVGTWTLYPTLALYVTIKTLVEVINEHVLQVNFLGRVIRDNS